MASWAGTDGGDSKGRCWLSASKRGRGPGRYSAAIVRCASRYPRSRPCNRSKPIAAALARSRSTVNQSASPGRGFILNALAPPTRQGRGVADRPRSRREKGADNQAVVLWSIRASRRRGAGKRGGWGKRVAVGEE